MEEAAKTRPNKKDTLINISSDTFVRVVILLAVLLILIRSAGHVEKVKE